MSTLSPQRTTALFWIIVSLAALAVVLSPAPEAAGGTPVLDPNFGTGGVAVFDISPGDTDRAYALDIQPDGKIVTVGERSGFDDLTVARFNADGSVDTDFAVDGVYTTGLVRRGADVEVGAGGIIYAVGTGDEHIVKLGSNGTPDTGFSGDGVSGSQFFNPDDQDETEQPNMYRLLVWPGSKVIVGGTIDYGPYFFTFARYSAAVGTLDDTFGDDGQVQTDFAPSPDDFFDQEPLALATYPGDRFIAAGYRDVTDDAPTASVIARYTNDGELDDAFGDDGKTTDDFFASDESIKEVFALADDRILAIGDGLVDPGNFGAFEEQVFIARYDSDGTLNSTFGNGGVIIYDRDGTQEVEAAGIAPDGSIVIGGEYSDNTGARPFLARFGEDGTPDPNFGDNGFLVVDLPGYTNVQFEDLAFDEHGNILVAGSLTQGSETMTAVFKFGTAGSGDARIWADWNCADGPNPVDSLLNLRHDAGLATNTGDCPDMGQTVDVQNASEHIWGDADCNGVADPVDSLKLLRFDAGLSVSQEEGCPEIGTEVQVATG